MTFIAKNSKECQGKHHQFVENDDIYQVFLNLYCEFVNKVS